MVIIDDGNILDGHVLFNIGKICLTMFLIEIQFSNNSEYGVELCSYSAAGVELVYLPSLYLNNELVGISSSNGSPFYTSQVFYKKAIFTE